MVSEQIMVSSRFVLPDPLGPPTSTCGDTSASGGSRGSPSTNPTGAQSALRESPRLVALLRQEPLERGGPGAPPVVLVSDGAAGVDHVLAGQWRVGHDGDVTARSSR